MTALYLYDDARARAFEPFALTRPAAELRAGALVIRERWERAFGVRAAATVAAAHLAAFEELAAPPAARHDLPAGAVLANSRCVPALGAVRRDAAAWSCGGRVAAVRLDRPVALAELADGRLALEALVPSPAAAGEELAGRWADEIWELVRDLPAQLADDIVALGPTLPLTHADGATVLGAHQVFVEAGAAVEPHVVFDVAAGPVLVRRGAVVHSFTRLVGPCYVGPDSAVLGDRVAACSIGEVCRVHGDTSNTVFLGHANKGHDGFVGHSYLGRWVNLGAGTVTSNLKNTYGPVAVWTPAGLRDTGMQFLGTLFGDHAKTGIGLRLTTGSVIGAGASVVGDAAPKAVAPFAWGDGAAFGTYRLDKFLEVAERAMARRQVPLGEGARRQLAAAHAARWTVAT